MNRISLPGKTKNKKIILFILILISILILIYEFDNNRKNKTNNKGIDNINNEQLIGEFENTSNFVIEFKNLI